jgi:hypothetical protein
MLHGFSQAHHQLSPLLAERLYPYWQSYRPSQALVITGSGAGWLTKVRHAHPHSSDRFILSLGKPFAKEGNHGEHASSV